MVFGKARWLGTVHLKSNQRRHRLSHTADTIGNHNAVGDAKAGGRIVGVRQVRGAHNGHAVAQPLVAGVAHAAGGFNPKDEFVTIPNDGAEARPRSRTDPWRTAE